MDTNATVSIIICASCTKYRMKQTDFLEVLYHCALDTTEVVEKGIKEVKKSTPRVDEAMLKNKCNNFNLIS